MEGQRQMAMLWPDEMLGRPDILKTIYWPSIEMCK